MPIPAPSCVVISDIKTRKQITTIQGETSRTMDSMTKMYQRGFIYRIEDTRPYKTFCGPMPFD